LSRFPTLVLVFTSIFVISLAALLPVSTSLQYQEEEKGPDRIVPEVAPDRPDSSAVQEDGMEVIVGPTQLPPDTRTSEGTRNAISPRTSPELTYALITPSSFLNNLQPLIDWKTQKGVLAQAFTLEDIYLSHSLQPDDGARVQAFLRELYTNNTALQWVLLVGDSQIIPARSLVTNASAHADPRVHDNTAISDYYYAGLDSTWDTNGNGVYGEVGEEDLSANVYVGRLPVDNPTQVQIVVQKFLNYEKDPPRDLPNMNWFRSSLFLGALMDRPNILNNISTEDVDEGYDWYKDNAYETVVKAREFLPSHMKAYNTTLYDYNQRYGGNYTTGDDVLDHDWVMTYLEQGQSIVDMVSHGYEDGDGMAHWDGSGYLPSAFSTYFDYNDAYNLTNGGRLPFYYMSSCDTLKFQETDDTNMEQLILAPNGGAIGMIGGTVTTYRGEFKENDTSWGNWWMNEKFFELFFSGYDRPGENLYHLKELYAARVAEPENPHLEEFFKSLYRANLFAYNLVGDPEIPIWTNVPREMTLTVTPRVLSPQPEIEINVTDSITGSGVPNAKVCIVGDGLYIVESTDSQGNLFIQYPFERDSQISLTVTARNCLPNEQTVVFNSSSDIYISGDLLVTANPPLYNGGGVTGTAIEFFTQVGITGPEAAIDLKAAFFDGDPTEGGARIGNDLTLGYLEPGTLWNISFSWKTTPGDHDVYFMVDPDDEIFEAAEGNNHDHVTIYQNNPPSFLRLPPLYLLEDTILEHAFTLSTYTYDPDTPLSELVYSIQSLNGSEVELNLSRDGGLSVRPKDNWFGTMNATLSVSDGLSVNYTTASITVAPVNDLPVIYAQNDVTVAQDKRVEVSFSAYDIDNDDLIYSVSSPSFEKGLLSEREVDPVRGVLSIISRNEDVGTHDLEVTVSDGSDSVNTSFKVTVINRNDAPTIKGLVGFVGKSEMTLTLGEPFSTSIIVSDPDVDDLLTFQDTSALFDIDPNTGVFSFTPTEEGRFTVVFSVTDSEGAIANMTFVFIVEGDDVPEEESSLMLPVIIAMLVTLVLFFILYKTQRMKFPLEEEGPTEEDGEPEDDQESVQGDGDPSGSDQDVEEGEDDEASGKEGSDIGSGETDQMKE